MSRQWQKWHWTERREKRSETSRGIEKFSGKKKGVWRSRKESMLSRSLYSLPLQKRSLKIRRLVLETTAFHGKQIQCLHIILKSFSFLLFSLSILSHTPHFRSCLCDHQISVLLFSTSDILKKYFLMKCICQIPTKEAWQAEKSTYKINYWHSPHFTADLLFITRTNTLKLHRP